MELQDKWQVPKVIAHRGASAHAPENTLAALRKAHALGARWVEFDVMLASRGQAIVFHDNTLSRTTNGRGITVRTSYKVISQLDAGSWFSDDYAGEKVPTLDEWLKTAAELKMGINLELKQIGRRRIQLLADHVIASLARTWSSNLPRPLISSAHLPCLRVIRRMAPNIQLGFITDHWLANWQQILERYRCVSIHMNHQRLSAYRVSKIKSLGWHVLAYTVNDKNRAQELFAMGVDGIFSDNVHLLK